MNKPQTITVTVEQVTPYTLTLDTDSLPANVAEMIGDDWSGENLRRIASENLWYITDAGIPGESTLTLTALSATVRTVVETTDLLATTATTATTGTEATTAS